MFKNNICENDKDLFTFYLMPTIQNENFLLTLDKIGNIYYPNTTNYKYYDFIALYKPDIFKVRVNRCLLGVKFTNLYICYVTDNTLFWHYIGL